MQIVGEHILDDLFFMGAGTNTGVTIPELNRERTATGVNHTAGLAQVFFVAFEISFARFLVPMGPGSLLRLG